MKLIYSSQSQILSTSFQDEGPEAFKTIPDGTPGFIASDARNDAVFWSDYASYQGAIYKQSITNNSNDVVVDSNVYSPVGVAYDWITNNLYFADTKLNFIAVCTQNPTRCNIILQDDSIRPVDIALHPNEGIMFWADTGENGGIRKCAMDGTALTTIHPIGSITYWDQNGLQTNEKVLPYGLTIDEHSSRIYWTDPKNGKIESSMFDGSDRQLVRNSVNAFDVDVLGDFVFWSDLSTKKIMSANKLTGEIAPNIIVERHAKNLAGFSIMHVSKQPILRSNPCKILQCSRICVLANSTARCLPNEGGGESDKPNLYVAYRNKLLEMSINEVGRNILKEIQLPNQITAISAVVGNPINQTLIVSDSVLRQIVEIVPTANGSKNFTVLVDGIENVPFIAIDLISENLIWIEEDNGTVEAMSLRTRRKYAIEADANNVHDMFYSSSKRKLYISRNTEVGVTIEEISLEIPSSKTSFVPSLQYSGRIKLSYDIENHEIIFVTNVGADVVVNGISNFSTQKNVIGKYLGNSATDVISIYNKLFWVDNSSNLRVLSQIGTDYFPHKIRIDDGSARNLGGRKLLAFINKINYYQIKSRNYHQCSPLNVDRIHCEHICLPIGSGNLGKCKCSAGYDLAIDQISCTRPVELNLNVTNSEPEKETIISVPVWMCILISIVCAFLSVIVAYLVIFWWKTRKFPDFITEPFVRFTSK